MYFEKDLNGDACGFWGLVSRGSYLVKQQKLFFSELR